MSADHLQLGGDGIIRVSAVFAQVNRCSVRSFFHGSAIPFFGIKNHDNGRWPRNLSGFVTQWFRLPITSPVEGMFFSPFLDANHIGGAAPVFPIPRLGQPALVARDFARLLTALLRAETLVERGFRVGCKRCLTTGTFYFAEMLFLHPSLFAAAVHSSFLKWIRTIYPLSAPKNISVVTAIAPNSQPASHSQTAQGGCAPPPTRHGHTTESIPDLPA